MSKMLCAPSKTGAAAGGLTGLVVWALMSFIPAFHSGVPEPVVAAIPVALAWIGHVAGAYFTPHPKPVTATPAAPVKPAV